MLVWDAVSRTMSYPPLLVSLIVHPHISADSGELTPGYPLFIMLGHLFFRFLPLGTPGFRINCLSCLCGASATMTLFFFCQRWYASRGYRASCGWALLVAGSWALSPLLWQYHVQAEVFSLNNLIVAVQFLLAQLHHETCDRTSSNSDEQHRKRRARTLARLGALAVGLGFSNQHAIVFYSFPIVIAGDMSMLSVISQLAASKIYESYLPITH